MNAKFDGGPAYPRPLSVSHGGVHAHQLLLPEQDGMSLRDRIAIAAMQSVLTWPDGWSKKDDESYEQALARISYEYADAMLVERAKGDA